MRRLPLILICLLLLAGVLPTGAHYYYSSPRADYSDSRNFAYGNWRQRLTQETFNLGNGSYGTNTYQFDNGSGGGLGVLTKATGSSAVPTWTGGVDAFSRVNSSTNTVIHRTAWGTVNGSATLRGYLDGKPIDLHYDSGGASPWTADLALFAGTNTLTVYADHPSGQFTTNTQSTFIVTNTASDRESCLYDGAGNVTNRVWKNAAGQVTKTETLTWDAFGNLVRHTSRDATNGGFNATAVFDALGRQLRTVETAVSNNVATATNPCPLVVTFTYDPLVEFQFVGISLSQGAQTRQDWMSYGPDISGTHGGMQGVGGLETIDTSDDGTGKAVTYGVVSDTFGNVLGGITNKTGGVDWNKAKVSLYGPVEGFAAPMLKLSAPSYQSFAWRTRPPSQGGTVQLGRRRYDFARRAFLSADSLGHGSDWALNTAFGGRPSVYFDARGMCIQQAAWRAEEGFDTLVDATLGTISKPQYGNAPQLDPIQNTMQFFTGHDAYIPSSFGDTMKNVAKDTAPYAQDILFSFGGRAGNQEITEYRPPETQSGSPLSPYYEQGERLDLSFATPSTVPPQLEQGRQSQNTALAALGLSENQTTFTPTPEQIQSAAFQVIVGTPKYTPGGQPVGTKFDSTDNGVYLEHKAGTSMLDSSYQQRLQTYFSVVNNVPYVVQTTRPVNSDFADYLKRWGATIQQVPKKR